VTAELHGARFWVKLNGVPYATPLMIVLLSLEMTDILFAVDSVPAIFAVTREPLVIFTSNIFAILGLRSAYFLLAGAVDKFYLLKYGISVVLVFIGLKMLWLNRVSAGQFPTYVSLAIIVVVILTSIGFLYSSHTSTRRIESGPLPATRACERHFTPFRPACRPPRPPARSGRALPGCPSE